MDVCANQSSVPLTLSGRTWTEKKFAISIFCSDEQSYSVHFEPRVRFSPASKPRYLHPNRTPSLLQSDFQGFVESKAPVITNNGYRAF